MSGESASQRNNVPLLLSIAALALGAFGQFNSMNRDGEKQIADIDRRLATVEALSAYNAANLRSSNTGLGERIDRVEDRLNGSRR